MNTMVLTSFRALAIAWSVVGGYSRKNAASAANAANTSAAYGGLWQNLSLDAGRIDNNMPPDALAKAGLFHYEVDGSREMEAHWHEFKDFLLKRDPNWSFWTDWYDACLKGGPQSESFEKALLILTEKDWNKKPADVNAQLVALQEEFDKEIQRAPDLISLEHYKQKPAAYQYDIIDDIETAIPFIASNQALPDEGELQELIHQAKSLQDEINERGFDNRPLASSIANALERVEGHLSSFNPGALKMASKLIEEFANQFETPEAKDQFPPETLVRAKIFANLLSDFVANRVEIILIEREVDKIKNDEMVAENAIANFDEVKAIITNSRSMAPSVLPSLQIGDADITKIDEEIATTYDDAELSKLRKMKNWLISQKVPIFRNFIRRQIQYLNENTSGIRKELKEIGIENWEVFKKNMPEASKLGPKTMLFCTIASLVDPVSAGVVITALSGGDLKKAVENVLKKNNENGDKPDDPPMTA